MQFSVLMSLYINEKAEYAKACFDSLLAQTIPAAEWVIVEDGPLTEEMYDLLNKYQDENPGLIRRIVFKKNHGLGVALRKGVCECKYPLIARMDTDDIARADRFEKQLALFQEDSGLDICGSHVKEFEGTIRNVLSIRKVPLSNKDIQSYQKRRDAFNHMTVMFKKDAVLKAGNYKPCLLMEDSLLWANMIMSGAKCANVDDYLVFARTGDCMFERRGGFAYYKKYKAGRKKIYKTGFISWWDYFYTIMAQFIVAILPNKLRGWVYKKLLRS